MPDLTGAVWKKSSRSDNTGNCVEVALNLVGADWQKSSRSNNVGNCVEVALNLVDASWQKSTRSNNSASCVEVARNLPGVVGVRDSKDPAGPALTCAPAAWVTFADAVRTGEHNLEP